MIHLSGITVKIANQEDTLLSAVHPNDIGRKIKINPQIQFATFCNFEMIYMKTTCTSSNIQKNTFVTSETFPLTRKYAIPIPTKYGGALDNGLIYVSSNDEVLNNMSYVNAKSFLIK